MRNGLYCMLKLPACNKPPFFKPIQIFKKCKKSQLTCFCKSNINQIFTNGGGMIWAMRSEIFMDLNQPFGGRIDHLFVHVFWSSKCVMPIWQLDCMKVSQYQLEFSMKGDYCVMMHAKTFRAIVSYNSCWKVIASYFQADCSEHSQSRDLVTQLGDFGKITTSKNCYCNFWAKFSLRFPIGLLVFTAMLIWATFFELLTTISDYYFWQPWLYFHWMFGYIGLLTLSFTKTPTEMRTHWADLLENDTHCIQNSISPILFKFHSRVTYKHLYLQHV